MAATRFPCSTHIAFDDVLDVEKRHSLLLKLADLFPAQIPLSWSCRQSSGREYATPQLNVYLLKEKSDAGHIA